MVKKKSVSWTIDKEIIEEVDKAAEKEDRSSSYVANEILKNNFDKKESKN